MSKKVVTHTVITIETICKNGSERYGAKAKCKAGYQGETQMEISMHGETKEIAKQKLMRFLTSDGEELLLV